MTSRDYVVVDLETTGLDYKLDRILEIGAVRVRGGMVVEEFQALVNPEAELREANIAIHHITPAMVAAAPLIQEVLPAFLAFLGAEPVVAHNALFDMNFLGFNARTYLGLELQNTTIDTLELAREVFPAEKGPSLERLLELFGEPPRPLHRALEDARALAAVFPSLIEALNQRRAYQRQQFERIEHVALRYRELGRLIDLMQREYKDLRCTLELYFRESGNEAVVVPGGETLRHQQNPSYEFHPEEARAALAELGILDRVLRLDREKLDRYLKGDRLSDEQKATVLDTRRFLGFRSAMSWERPSVLE